MRALWMFHDADLCTKEREAIFLLSVFSGLQAGNIDLSGAPDPRRRSGANHSGAGSENASDTDDSDKTGTSVESSR